MTITTGPVVRPSLKYRLQAAAEPFGVWGHEFVR